MDPIARNWVVLTICVSLLVDFAFLICAFIVLREMHRRLAAMETANRALRKLLRLKPCAPMDRRKS